VSSGEPADAFAGHRPSLLRLAYRMLGSMADAEDVVQDAWLRWNRAERDEVRNKGAFLGKVVTRLCLDRMKSAQFRREAYFGPWLPEPVVEEEVPEDVTLPLLLALERLSPLERAAFLLHDVFGQGFDAIAETIGRDPAACRQLASRARQHVRSERPRYPVSRAHGLEIAGAFFAASQAGDVAALGAMLSEDVRLHSDGGGKRPAAGRVLNGIGEVMRALAAISRLAGRDRSRSMRLVHVNGLPGYVTRETDGLLQTTAFLIDEDRITAIYVMRNPDKLERLERTLH